MERRHLLYYANLLVDADDRPARELVDFSGLHVRGTVPLGDGLGSLLSIDENIPVDAPGPGEPEIIQLDRSRFELEMSRAKTFQELEPDRADYWSGYMRGLRRANHGERFGTAAEHTLWLDAVNSDDPMRIMRGCGYRDGLKGEPDHTVGTGNSETVG